MNRTNDLKGGDYKTHCPTILLPSVVMMMKIMMMTMMMIMVTKLS